MIVFAIDPGNEQSAFVAFSPDTKTVLKKGILKNDEMLKEIDVFLKHFSGDDHDFVIEMIASYGMPVGETIFHTCVWVGRFTQKIVDSGNDVTFLYRKEIKGHLCGMTTAKDSDIRRALINRFNSVVKGLVKDEWAALAVAVTYSDFSKTLTEHPGLKKEIRHGQKLRAGCEVPG